MSALAALITNLSPLVHSWIVEQRELHIASARELTAIERVSLRSYFDERALSGARIKAVREIENPPFYQTVVRQLADSGIQTQFDLRDSVGITFADCVLVRENPPTSSLLFHEFVHVVQYQELGTERFAAHYVNGLAEVGFVYEEIPLERIAHEMQQRFDLGGRFIVRVELQQWLRTQRYI